MYANVKNALPRSRPEAEGIASALDDQVNELHSFMLLRHGCVVAEGWWSPYRAEYLHLMFSVSKSFTSTAVGLAVAEGLLSIDERVLSFFPDERPAEVNDFLNNMTVRHLLTMTTGHDVDTWPYQIKRPDGNWVKAFLNVTPVHPPGTFFLYNTGASHILAAIVQKLSGLKLVDYLQPRLFEPLGINKATWQESPLGIAAGGYGISITSEDLARFGLLYLQNGRWGERQILPADWVEAAVSAQVAGSNPGAQSDYTQGYGYQFWRCRHEAYQASGVFGQCCIVMPQQDAVLVFTAGIDLLESQQLLDLVWDKLLAAFESGPLVEDAADRDALAKKLAALALAPVQSAPGISQPRQVAKRTYAFDVNELGFEYLTLDFAPSACAVLFKTAAGEQRLDCGYGEWRQGQSNLFNRLNGPWLPDYHKLVFTSGGWINEDSFKMIVRLVETPFYFNLLFHFMDDELLVEIRVNISLDLPKTLLLTARLSNGAGSDNG
ncbi:MAG: beta-lactamase family protein [Anaerolineae bacterium]|nr:beta-lactamase family protein [Anaerolineae bacterium]